MRSEEAMRVFNGPYKVLHRSQQPDLRLGVKVVVKSLAEP